MRGRIVTHPGSAHFDEFLAVSLVLAARPETNFCIERRDPRPEELDDPATWVIDIGNRHEPALLNFDHHQDLDLPSSFVLVARHLGLHERLSRNIWWDYKDRIDRFGPYQVAEEMQTATLKPTFSPFEEWFLEEFEKSPLTVYQVMKLFGRSLIDAAEHFERQYAFWQGAEQRRVRDKVVLIGLTEDATGAQEVRDDMPEPATIAVTYDSRGEGWKLYRFNDDASVDFSRVESHPQIAFAHKGGFIAKTATRIPLDDVMEIVARAIK